MLRLLAEFCTPAALLHTVALHSLKQSLGRSLSAMRVELPDSHIMVGVPDASRSVPAGCVVALGANGRTVVQSGPVLLYHAPGRLPEDIVRATAVEPPPQFMKV